MNTLLFKRFIANAIDILIISLLTGLIININFINPSKNEYTNSVNKLNEYMEEYKKNMENSENDTKPNVINDEYKSIIYDVSKYGKNYYLIDGIIIILYFTLFPLIYEGQTIGKKIVKLKVIHQEENKKVSFWQYFFRAIITPIFKSLFFFCSINYLTKFFIILFLNKNTYFYTDMVISYIFNIILLIDVLFIVFRKDHKALHDIITKTGVVEC